MQSKPKPKPFSIIVTITIGSKQGLANVIVKEAMITGWKSKILGYISNGERVPEVMTTLWNLSKTGFMAIEESRHLKV